MRRSTGSDAATDAAASWSADLGRCAAILSMLLALLAVAGCQSPQAEPATAASGMAVVVSVRPERVVLTPGDSAQLQCQANDVDGGAVGGAEFTFESEDPAIANVDRFGRTAAAGPAGDTSIVVRSGTLLARVPV